jgi:WD40 repeat protein
MLSSMLVAAAIAFGGAIVRGAPPVPIDQTTFPADIQLAPAAKLAGHTDAVLAMAFSPDGKWLATAGQDKSIFLWDTATGKQVRRVGGHTRAIHSLAFSPDGTKLASGGEMEVVARVWDVAKGDLVAELTDATQSATSSLEFSGDGKQLLTTNLSGTFTMWDWDNEKAIQTAHPNPAEKVLPMVRPGAKQYLIWDFTNLEVYDSDTNAMAGTTELKTANNFGFAPDGNVVMVAQFVREEGRPPRSFVSRWNFETGKTDEVDLPYWGRGQSFTADGKFVELASVRGDIGVVDLKSAQVVKDLTGPKSFAWLTRSSRDGRYVAAACAGRRGPYLAGQRGDFTVYLWDLKANQ